MGLLRPFGNGFHITYFIYSIFKKAPSQFDRKFFVEVGINSAAVHCGVICSPLVLRPFSNTCMPSAREYMVQLGLLGGAGSLATIPT